MQALRTRLDDTPEGFSEYERRVVEQVREHGWRSTHVFDEREREPSFTYTTGFWFSLGYPEVIVFDFPGELAHDVFGQMFRELQRGRALPTGEPVEGILSGEHIYLLAVKGAAASDHLLSSRWFYKEASFPCLQLVWADQSGSFPWEEDFDDRLLKLQPDLSERGWKTELKP